MASDVEDAFYSFLRTAQFSLRQDESTLPGNEALLLINVRFIKEEKLNQDISTNSRYFSSLKQSSNIKIMGDLW
ncbi:hypothetical protein T10_10955 [Trichinella papuae]|uniref:Uncharacterized protein n=1 Tax=Trichinella papuae TaxID=268474 RepID=A0A0V1MTW1_9BILA|nr:hypothetical protein T10_10955 [Trichinella papuae]